MSKEDDYKIISSNYWDHQYKTVGWRTVNDSGGVDKTKILATREIDLYLWPTKDKVDSLINDKENNPYPTMTPDMDRHPQFKGEYLRCLDYGCGGLARYSCALGRYFSTVIGVDISSEAVLMARSCIKESGKNNIFIKMCNGVSLDFPNNYFDFIFSNLVLQHIGDKWVNFRLAKEFARVLRPGGMARLEYLDSSQNKGLDFSSPVEGNGIEVEEIREHFEAGGAKIVCHTESYPWLWITVTKE